MSSQITASFQTHDSDTGSTPAEEPVKHRSRWLGPALFAVVSLVIIQVCVGILLKVVQEHDTYAFSPSSLVCMGEFLKFIVAASLLYLSQPCDLTSDSYIPLRHSKFLRDDELALADFDGEDPIEKVGILQSRWLHVQVFFSSRLNRRHLNDVWLTTKEAVDSDFIYGFIHLAILYALVNNLAFVLYNIADPGTVQLIKSSTTVMTVIITYFSQKATINSSQWIAVALQICGLMVTQYRPQKGTLLEWSVYAILLLHTFAASVASVYNASLYKSFNTSVHLGNMVLYATGTVVNLVIHTSLRIASDVEPRFFAGFDRLSTWMILASGILVSLAMTAVFKYADAIIRAMASSLSTGILIYLSHIVFLVELPFVVLPGTLVVFLATWLYTKEAIAESDTKEFGTDHHDEKDAQQCTVTEKGNEDMKWLLFCATVSYGGIIIGTVIGITLWKG